MLLKSRMNLHISAALLLCITAGGCATGGQKLTQSGFLPDYQQLDRVDDKRNAALWIDPSYRPQKYAKVVVEPIEWQAKSRDAEVQQTLQDKFRASLTEALSPRYRVVDAAAAGHDTLRIRAAITNTRRTRWFVNAPAQIASTLTFGTVSLLAPLQGGASVEMEAVDAATGRPVLRMAAYRNGRSWEFKGNYVAYAHADKAFAAAAELLHGALSGNGEVVRRENKPAYRQKGG